MSYNATVVRTFMSFGVLLAASLIGWAFPVAALPASLIALVLAFVNIFKTQPNAGLVLAYAAFEGVTLGGVSRIYESLYAGIVPQAVFGTLGVVGAVLVLFLNGKVHTSPLGWKIWNASMWGMIAYGFVNWILVITGVSKSLFGLDSQITVFGIPLGIVLGLVCVGLGAYSLVGNFEVVQEGVANRVDAVYEWRAAFGIMLTVVWLYLEILRILALANRRR
jgi:uncharacterized YccA/Bax inhibitor family protein